MPVGFRWTEGGLLIEISKLEMRGTNLNQKCVDPKLF